MSKIALTIFTILLGLTTTVACINIYYTADEVGDMHQMERLDFEKKLNKNFNAELIVKKLKDMDAELKMTADYMLLNDYATLLLKLGKTEEALNIFIALFEDHPNEYALASNLGTAYELNGEIDSALKYIEIGMDLNPDAHGGSEWVHIKVLETKNKLKEDSTYLASNTVLDLNVEQEKDTVVMKQLWIQIMERFPFSPGPDKIMGSLMTDLGDCFKHNFSVEYALAFYQIAETYYGDSSAVLTDKIEKTKVRLDELKSVRPDRNDHPREENHLRVGYTNFNEMMDDHYNPNYSIPWDEIETNADTLLSWVGLERYEFPEPIEQVEAHSDVKPEPKKSDSLIWILLGGGLLIMLGMYFYLRKNKR